MQTEPTTNGRSSGKLYLFTCLVIVNILGITCGMMMAWSSPVLAKLELSGEDNPLGYPVTTTQKSIIGSGLAFGAIIGPYSAAFLSEKFGRKPTLITTAVLFIAGITTLAFTKLIYLYYAARIIIGFAYGSVYTVLPVYLIEFAGTKNRGAIVNLTATFAVIGALLAYSIGPFVSIMVFNLICLIPPVIFLVLFITLMPDTPQDLLLKGNEELARKSYYNMSLGKGSEKEFDDIKLSIATKVTVPYSEILKVRSNLKALAITLGLMFFKQWSGTLAIGSYTQTIFAASNSRLPAEIPPIILAIVQLISTFAVPLFVNRYGRKFLLIVSASGMSISFVLVGVYFYLDDPSLAWLPVVSLVGSKVSFGVGFLSVVWLIMAELMPYNVKAKVSALVNSFCWAMLFTVTFAIPPLFEHLGMAATFWIFAGVNLASLAYVLVFLQETKGKSPMEIQDMLNGKK